MTQLAVCLKILLSLVNCTINLNSKMMDSATEYLKEPMQGLVFESFQMLDMECAPALIIVASNAAHSGSVVFRPMYCKLLLDFPFWLIYFWLVYFSACLFNLKEPERSKGVCYVQYFLIFVNMFHHCLILHNIHVHYHILVLAKCFASCRLKGRVHLKCLCWVACPHHIEQNLFSALYIEVNWWST